MSTSPFLAGRRTMCRLRFLPLVGLLAGGVFAAAPTPASAQFYSPYYEAPGYYYGPPRAYRYRQPDAFPASDVRPMLRSMGFVSIDRVRVTGRAYVTEATDGDGVRLRVRIDRFSGDIISMRPIGVDRAMREPVPPASVRLPPKKPPAPKTAALPPTAPLPPPAGEAPGRAPANAAQAKPETAPATEAPATETPATEAPAAAKPAAAEPADSKSATPTKEAAAKPETPPAETPIRAIPGVTGPTPEAPPPVANAKAGTGAGTATPSGSVSAGSASVLTRSTVKKPAGAKPGASPD